MTTTRRSILGLMGAAPVAAGSVAALAPRAHAASGTGSGHGGVPADLRPDGALDRFIAELAERDEFSGSVLVARRGREVLARSHGSANRERSVPNGPDTAFILGSINKIFTAVAIAQLVEQRALRYDDTLGSLLGGFPAGTAERVTVHHMLTHTSGMGDFHGSAAYRERSPAWDSAEEVMNGITDVVRELPLLFDPGAGQTYSNSAFHVLGAIVQEVAGVPYHDYVRERVFEAAEMAGAAFLTRTEWRADPEVARPYAPGPDGGELVEVIDAHGFIGTPAGGAFATCLDLVRFARALTAGELVGSAQAELLLSPKMPLPGGGSGGPGEGGGPGGGDPVVPEPGRAMTFEGYGTPLTLSGDTWVVIRSGGSAGVSTSLQVFPPAAEWAVVVLSNYGERAGAPIADLARQILTS
ncbi:serine hydrolase domain-containing protein [Streptomyces sp. MP131-18]|uniref:serine hydrolase domain-containing protein n=1 Tax=Streptomyces sp. MP131-18 TaxID=1857892 RepID=UPI00097CA19B|nr:serine hydrolase domain-containing protein [Streptomyces sp. MP131-18]